MHIQQTPDTVARSSGTIPQPSKQAVVLPPPKAAAKVETYSVVVTNLPAREVLFALARDAKINIDINSGIEGLITLNAINQTLPQILDRISKQIDMRYTLDNGNLFVEADTPFLKTYKIDFINMSRTVSSKLFTSSQVGGASSNTSGGNSASTTVTSETKNNLVESLVANIKAIISDEDRIRHSEKLELRNEMRAQAEYAQGNSGSENSNEASNKAQQPQQASKYEPAVNINANSETGVIIVRATSRQHSKVQEFLTKVMQTARRQVLIEATIAEVSLNSNYQQGINWSKLASGTSGFSFDFGDGTPTPTATANGMLAIGYANPASKFGNISSAVKLLDSFGDVKVLSSPKLSVMNNQTATIKVVDNRIYFTVQVTPGGCKNFCVNGHLAGNCRHFERSSNDRSKSTTSRFDRQPAVWL
ncbi:hypothetical protein [Sideroxydans sp.]